MLQCLFTDPESCLFWLCPNAKDWANNLLNHGVKIEAEHLFMNKTKIHAMPAKVLE